MLIAAIGRQGRSLLLWVLAALFAAPYWLGPVLIWLTNKSRVPQWESPAPNGLADLPLAMRPFFERTDMALVQDRFELVAVLRQATLAPGFTSWVALYVNRTQRERAVAHAHMPDRPHSAIRPKPSFYFVTHFADERLVETANGDHINPFPAVAGKDSRQFPEVDDPRVLYRIHQIRSAPFGSALRKFPAEGAEVPFLTQAMADFYKLHVGTGYLREVEPDRLFRPTAKGALVMTWTLLPPLSWLARRNRARKNRAFLAEHYMLAV